MECASFGKCGGCSEFELLPSEALRHKADLIKEGFLEYFQADIPTFSSPSSAFRARAEFRFHKDHNDTLHYATNLLALNSRLAISFCPSLIQPLQNVFAPLLSLINQSEILSHKLYSVSFLGTLKGDVIVALIYHKKLDLAWEHEIHQVQSQLQIKIQGISKGTKIGESNIEESFNIKNKTLKYIRKINRFSQPNPFINQKMLEYVIDKITSLSIEGDLLELYCGSGNFTIALSPYFKKIFATEVVKDSIFMLKENIIINNLSNITIARLNAYESIQAFKKERAFFRLKDIDIESFNFSTILVDPPRAGIGDIEILDFLSSFQYIIYISCNPATLKIDMQTLSKTHIVLDLALFDQFPYTPHIESICILCKR